MEIDGLGDSFDTRDSDSEDEGIKEGRKKIKFEDIFHNVDCSHCTCPNETIMLSDLDV